MKKIPKLSFKTPLFWQKSRHWQRAGLSNLRLFETGISEFLISLVVIRRKKGAKNSELNERLGRIKGRDRIASIFELCSSSSYSTSFFNKEPRPRLFRLLVCGKGGHLYHTDWTSRENLVGAIHSTKIPTGPTDKSGPPQKVDSFFRNFSGWTEPIHWVLDRNFRKFCLNGSRPVLQNK